MINEPFHVVVTKHIRKLIANDNRKNFVKTNPVSSHQGETSTSQRITTTGSTDATLNWIDPTVPYPPSWDDTVNYLQGYIAHCVGTLNLIEIPIVLNDSSLPIDLTRYFGVTLAKEVYKRVTYLERMQVLGDSYKELPIVKLQWDLTTMPPNQRIKNLLIKKITDGDATIHAFPVSVRETGRCIWDASRTNPTDKRCINPQAITEGMTNKGPLPNNMYVSPCMVGDSVNQFKRCWALTSGESFDTSVIPPQWNPNTSAVYYAPDNPDEATQLSSYIDREVISNRYYYYRLYAVTDSGNQQCLTQILKIQVAGDDLPPLASLADYTDYMNLTASDSEQKHIDLHWDLPDTSWRYDETLSPPIQITSGPFINTDIKYIWIYRIKVSDLTAGYTAAFSSLESTHSQITSIPSTVLHTKRVPGNSQAYIDVDGLVANTQYYYRIGMEDATGNIGPVYDSLGNFVYTSISYQSPLQAGLMRDYTYNEHNLVENGEMMDCYGINGYIVADLMADGKLPGWRPSTGILHTQVNYWPPENEATIPAKNFGGVVGLETDLGYSVQQAFFGTPFEIYQNINHTYYFKFYAAGRWYDVPYLRAFFRISDDRLQLELNSGSDPYRVQSIPLLNGEPGHTHAVTVPNDYGHFGTAGTRWTECSSVLSDTSSIFYIPPVDPQQYWRTVIANYEAVYGAGTWSAVVGSVPNALGYGRIAKYGQIEFLAINTDGKWIEICDLTIVGDPYSTSLVEGSTFKAKADDKTKRTLNIREPLDDNTFIDFQGITTSTDPMNFLGSGWLHDKAYPINSLAINGIPGNTYNCILEHVSDQWGISDNEPGVGLHWTTYWELNNSAYFRIGGGKGVAHNNAFELNTGETDTFTEFDPLVGFSVYKYNAGIRGELLVRFGKVSGLKNLSGVVIPANKWGFWAGTTATTTYCHYV